MTFLFRVIYPFRTAARSFRSWLQNPADERQSRRQYWLVYTLCFAVLFLLVFSWYLAAGRTFIWYNDGKLQHYTALVYYGEYLREIVKNLLHGGGLSLPEWDFTLGEGADILTTLHYYVIGDPLNLLAVFVPSRYMWMLYDALIAARMYLSGVAFSLFCTETGIKSRSAKLGGALVYVFCYWAIYNAARHIYFLNPMIYFPLILCGAEKIFKGKSPWPFVWAVVIAAVSNFYFFYMQVILTVVYVIVRMLPLLRREWKPALRRLLRLTGFAVLSALLSAAVLLPIMNAFLGSDRMSTQAAGLFFYPLSYYSRLPGLLLSTTDYYWLCLGLSAIVLPAVLLLFIRKKQHRTVKAFFLIGLVIILCPSLGQALNGFSYISNRWCWAFVLVCACIVTVMWPELLTLSGREAVLLAAATAGYLLLCLLADYSRGAEAFANIALALVVICIIVLYSAEIVGMRAFTAQSMLIVISGISIVSHGYWTNAYSAGNYASESMSIEELTETNLQREAMAVAEISEEETDEFFRYSGLSLTKNAGTNAGLSSTSSYWSITNAYAAEYREHLELLDNSS